MNYKEFINSILESRNNVRPKGVYMEEHHIIPRCMGGSNDIDNLVYLYPAEHLKAHELLYKENLNDEKLAYSFNMMCMSLSGLRADIDKNMINEARQAWYNAMNGENDPRAKAVICLETKQIWKSAREAAKSLNGNYENISQVCRGDKRTHKGFHFEFYHEEIHTDEYVEKTLKIKKEQDRLAVIPSKETMEKCRLAKIGKHRYDLRGKTVPKEVREKMSAAKLGKPRQDMKGGNNHEARRVINIDTKEVFNTLKEAAKSINKASSTVLHCCKGKQKTAGGYHWAYYEDYLL